MKYTATSIHKTCDTNPSQWEVNALPKPLYIRYRWSTLTVDIDEGDSLGERLLEQRFSGDSGGFLGTREMMEHTGDLIDWSHVMPEPKDGKVEAEFEVSEEAAGRIERAAAARGMTVVELIDELIMTHLPKKTKEKEGRK